MTQIPEDLKPLHDLALQHKAWIRCAYDAVTDDGKRISMWDLTTLIERIDSLEARLHGDGPTDTPVWRCFHCDFATSDKTEAQAHFGDRDDPSEFTPICKWWAEMDDTERKHAFQDALKDLEVERNQNGEWLDTVRETGYDGPREIVEAYKAKQARVTELESQLAEARKPVTGKCLECGSALGNPRAIGYCEPCFKKWLAELDAKLDKAEGGQG